MHHCEILEHLQWCFLKQNRAQFAIVWYGISRIWWSIQRKYLWNCFFFRARQTRFYDFYLTFTLLLCYTENCKYLCQAKKHQPNNFINFEYIFGKNMAENDVKIIKDISENTWCAILSFPLHIFAVCFQNGIWIWIFWCDDVCLQNFALITHNESK